MLLLALGCCAAPVFAQGSNPLAPTTGTLNNLVVFIRFSDQPEFAQPLAYYNGLFNSASNSLKNFYLENSYNALTVSSSFYPTQGGLLVSYQDAHPSAYYQAYDASTNPAGYQGTQSTARETALVTNALAAISAQLPGGLLIDSNNDGYVDHVTFEVYSSNAQPLPVLFYSRATYDVSGTINLGGKHLGSYTWVSASQDSPGTGSALGATEIHEMGHSFGYPDTRANSGRQPVGDWDVMANSTKVVHSGAWMKYKFTHWIANIPEITSYGTYTLNDLTQASNNSYRISLPNSSEFLILEYRKAAGTFESNLFGSGLCITRVNEAAGMWGNLGGPPFYLYYYRKDGTLSADGYGNAWDGCLSAETGRVTFNNTSNPACFVSNGSACGISITKVGSAASSSISFSVSDPAAAASITRRISGILTLGGNRVSNATLTLSGDTAGVTSTDSLGNYSFSVDDGGNYTVTPTKANLSFSPSTKSFTTVTSDQTANFSATANTNTISGTVSFGGTFLPGITVACNGGCTPQLATTDAAGAYAFTVNAGGTYDVYPAGLTGYYAFPYTKQFTNLAGNQTQNFTTQAITATTLVSSKNPGVSAQGLTFTATVTGVTPGGSVTFSSAGTNLCTAVLLTNAQAQCTTTSLAAGTHNIVAFYSGDSRNSTSTSDALSQTVTQAAGGSSLQTQTIGLISFTPDTLLVAGTITVSASATSGLAVSFTSSTPTFCSVSGNTVVGLRAGNCTIVAMQTGNSTYAPAQTQLQNITVATLTAPGAPTGVTAVSANTGVTVSFSAPASNGGSAVTSYTVTANPGGISATGTGSPITVNGLASGVSYTFTVTATNSAGSSVASTASAAVTLTQIVAPSGLLTTVTSNAPVFAAAGSTLLVAASAVIADMPITFADPAPGTSSVPVTLVIGTQTLSVRPLLAATRVALRAVNVNGTQKLALSVNKGRVTVFAESEGSLLLAGSASNVAIATSGNAVVSVDIDDTTGASALAVGSGVIFLPAGSFNAAKLRDGIVHASETVYFDTAGSVTRVRLGALTGAGNAGDPLHADLPANLALNTPVPALGQSPSRLQGATLLEGFTAVLAQATGLAFNASAQNASGLLDFTFNGGRVRALPTGEVVVDTSRADGLVVADNKFQVTSQGLVTTVVPGVGNLADFASQLSALAANSTATIQPDGSIIAAIGTLTYVLQPGWLATSTVRAAGISNRDDGYLDYVDAAGNLQVLYPAFADLTKIVTTFRALDPAFNIVAKGNGAFVATLAGKTYTLSPDYVLGPLPAAHINDAWWRDENGKVFIQYSEGLAQGFGVK